MATYNDIKKIKIGDNVFVIHVPTASEVGALPSSTTIPTKTSQLTNDSGFITTDTNTWRAIQVNGTQVLAGTTGTNALNLKAGTGISLTNSSGTVTITNSSTNTDEKVKAVAATASTKYYLVMGGNGGTAETKVYDARLSYTNTTDYSALTIGDASHSGNIQLYDSTSSYKSVLETAQLTEARTLSLPDKTGTIALVSDIAAISYPVTSVNSKTGAVSLSASDVGALASNTTYVSKITTTAGAHTTISNKSGAVSFNVPTKTSHLTNDSGFTTNTGTVTGVKINGTTKSPTSGVVDLGTVITSHQTIPVTSVNSKTGAVSLSASDVEAMPATTLLWTNSSPTSSFTAKTVSLDLSAYSAIEIEFKHANSSNSFLYQKFKIPSDDMSLFYLTGKGTYFEFESRAVTVTTTGVTFADGRRAQATWTASSDNIRCVPTRIFGIK